MIDLILADAKTRPDLFLWRGPLDESRLLRWAADYGLTLPKDLMLLWLTTGGGDLFESETILGPLADRVLGDDVDSVNLEARRRGLSTDYMIIHSGLGPFTALHVPSQQYVQLDEKHNQHQKYDSLESWYVSVIRTEYAERYDLPSLG